MVLAFTAWEMDGLREPGAELQAGQPAQVQRCQPQKPFPALLASQADGFCCHVQALHAHQGLYTQA